MEHTENVNKAAGAPSALNAGLGCFYVAYQTPSGISWRITETPLDLDKAGDLRLWIEAEERKRGVDIAPLFWKRLSA